MSRWRSGATGGSIQGDAIVSEAIIFRQPGLPVFQNKIYPDAESAKHAPVGDVELVQHLDSGLVHNHAFNPALVTYDADYQNEQATALRELTNADVFVMNQVYLAKICALVRNVNANF